MSNGRQVSPYACYFFFILILLGEGGGVLAYTFITFGDPVKSLLSTKKYRACSDLEWTPLNKGLCVSKELMRFCFHTSPICLNDHIWTTIGRKKVKYVLHSVWYCIMFVYRSTNIYQFFGRCAFVLAGKYSIF